MRFFILVDGGQTVEADETVFADWSARANRRIAHHQSGVVEVSTVFVGIDHRTFETSPARLFATTVLRDGRVGETWRHSSFDDARIGHLRICREVFGFVPDGTRP
ncbi:MAG TPA: hypothetical protein VEA81_19245 [Burkholderiaceae bacterium]|nr:hypothetical protein [Burkholderiaceae bacterium]